MSKKFVAIGNAVSFLGQVVQVGTLPVALPLMAVEKNGGPIVVAMIASLVWLPVFFMSAWVASLVSSLGAKLTCQIGMMATAFGSGLLLVSQELAMLTLASTVCGIGLAFRWIAADSLIVSYAGKSYMGRAVGIHETFMGLGMAVGPVIVAWLGAGPLLSFFNVFLSMLSFGLCFFLPGAVTKKRGKVSKFFFGRISPSWLAISSGAMEAFSLSFVVIFLVEKQWSTLHALYVLSAFGWGGSVLQPALGFLSDKFGYRLAARICFAVVIIASIFFIFIRPSLPLLIPIAVAFCWGGAAGGLNSLAVIVAGTQPIAAVRNEKISSVARSYTLGSAVIPGVVAISSYLSEGGLVFALFASVAAWFFFNWKGAV